MAKRRRPTKRTTPRAVERGDGLRGIHERLIVGYHGCERATARRVLLGEAELAPSTNDYDWLGHGIYFWEHGLTRAQQFADEKRERGELVDPVVIGAYLQLGRCLDLTDVWATRVLRDYYEDMAEDLATRGEALPENSRPVEEGGDSLRRRLDCAVVNGYVAEVDTESRTAGIRFGFDSVRGVFEEGPPAFAGAAMREKSHAQIAVRNPACILGVFRPTGYTL